MLITLECVLIGLVAGWATGRMMLPTSHDPFLDLLAGVIGGVTGGGMAVVLGAGAATLILTLVSAMLGAVVVTSARHALASRARPGWRHW